MRLWGEQSILRPSSAVSWYAFQDALTGANGRRILFLDTCHAANAFNARLLGDSYEANIMVYSSARGDQEAKEDPTLGGGHGLFTYALVEGVNGAARDGAGEVRAEGFARFPQEPRGRSGRESSARAGAAIFPRPRRGELRARPAGVAAGIRDPHKAHNPSSCPSPNGRRDALQRLRASPLSHGERAGVRGNAL